MVKNVNVRDLRKGDVVLVGGWRYTVSSVVLGERRVYCVCGCYISYGLDAASETFKRVGQDCREEG